MEKIGKVEDVIYELDISKLYLIVIKDKEYDDAKLDRLRKYLAVSGMKVIVLPMDDPTKIEVKEVKQISLAITGEITEVKPDKVGRKTAIAASKRIEQVGPKSGKIVNVTE